MRKVIAEVARKYTEEEIQFLNKSEMARKYNCDGKTIDRRLVYC